MPGRRRGARRTPTCRRKRCRRPSVRGRAPTRAASGPRGPPRRSAWRRPTAPGRHAAGRGGHDHGQVRHRAGAGVAHREAQDAGAGERLAGGERRARDVHGEGAGRRAGVLALPAPARADGPGGEDERGDDGGLTHPGGRPYQRNPLQPARSYSGRALQRSVGGTSARVACPLPFSLGAPYRSRPSRAEGRHGTTGGAAWLAALPEGPSCPRGGCWRKWAT